MALRAVYSAIFKKKIDESLENYEPHFENYFMKQIFLLLILTNSLLCAQDSVSINNFFDLKINFIENSNVFIYDTAEIEKSFFSFDQDSGKYFLTKSVTGEWTVEGMKYVKRGGTKLVYKNQEVLIFQAFKSNNLFYFDLQKEISLCFNYDNYFQLLNAVFLLDENLKALASIKVLSFSSSQTEYYYEFYNPNFEAVDGVYFIGKGKIITLNESILTTDFVEIFEVFTFMKNIKRDSFPDLIYIFDEVGQTPFWVVKELCRPILINK